MTSNETPRLPILTDAPTYLSRDSAVEQQQLPAPFGTHMEIIEDDNAVNVPVNPALAAEPHKSQYHEDPYKDLITTSDIDIIL